MALHPLEPLSAAEFRQTSAALRRDREVGDPYRYCSVVLDEPPKPDVQAWRPGDPVPRTALAVLWDRASASTYEARVDLVADAVVSFERVPGVMPNFTVDEWHECDAAMRTEPAVVEALAARGIHDMERVLFDVWAYGAALVPEPYRDLRVGWCDVWYREVPDGNPYAHPVAGLKPIVDLSTMRLLDIDAAGAVDPAPVMGEYAPPLVERLVPGFAVRDDLAPLHVSQPDGVSFALDGTELTWQRWSMRLGFTYREGPVVHQLRYDGRDVAYRLSFAEMVVPYRDASFEHYRRTAFDIGEWGLGFMTTSLELGCDCLGEIRYVDAVLHDTRGEPKTVRNAICLHEEDGGVLWKHVDGRTGSEVRRMRRFVLSCHVTVANYEYLVHWRFHEDGSIECEVRATGIMVTTPFTEGASTPVTGTLVDSRTYAPFHQHFLVARLDLDVDGPDNTVLEVDSLAAPVSTGNPYGLAVTTRSTPVRSEAESGRDYDWSLQRTWKVVNPGRTNAYGTPVAYKLVPSACLPPLMEPSTPQFQRAPVIGHQLWVTREHADERWPCGAYPTQSAADDGLTRWTADDEPLEDTDVVLWYVFGVHHITRVEDWPVMPVDTVSFRLVPFGFFDRNPALDVAPPPGHAHGHGPTSAAPH